MFGFPTRLCEGRGGRPGADLLRSSITIAGAPRRRGGAISGLLRYLLNIEHCTSSESFVHVQAGFDWDFTGGGASVVLGVEVGVYLLWGLYS